MDGGDNIIVLDAVPAKKRGRRSTRPPEICILEQRANKRMNLQQREAQFNFHPDNIPSPRH